jgi:DNA-binding transcriptional MerR regulator
LTITLIVLRISVMKNNTKTFTFDEICILTGLNSRKVRYYIQNNLVDRPEGTGKGAYYTHRHLEQLLAIRKWKDAGLSLERIQEILKDEKAAQGIGKPVPPPRRKQEGAVEVWSHLHITDGIELHIEPESSGLSPDQIRSLFREILKQYKKIKDRGD